MVIGPSGGYMPTKAFMITSKQRNPYKPNALRHKNDDGEDALGIKGNKRSKSRDRNMRTKSPTSTHVKSGRQSQEDIIKSKIKVVSNDSKMQQTET
jgi:hypothetical protein